MPPRIREIPRPTPRQWVVAGVSLVALVGSVVYVIAVSRGIGALPGPQAIGAEAFADWLPDGRIVDGGPESGYLLIDVGKEWRDLGVAERTRRIEGATTALADHGYSRARFVDPYHGIGVGAWENGEVTVQAVADPS